MFEPTAQQETKKLIVLANERDAPATQDEPSVSVKPWGVLKSVHGDLHLVMLIDMTAKKAVVRVTSPIAAVHSPGRAVITSSGRRYQLLAPPVADASLKQVLWATAFAQGLRDAVDVSAEIWSQMA